MRGAGHERSRPAFRARRPMPEVQRRTTKRRRPHPSRCALPDANRRDPIRVDDATYLLELVQRYIDPETMARRARDDLASAPAGFRRPRRRH
jgi:hypothetical protein